MRLIMKILNFLAIVFLLLAQDAFADEYKITRITDNDYPDAAVEICGSKLAWQARPDNSKDTEIFYFDGLNTFKLTDNNNYECTPSISSGGITWQMHRIGRGSDIFFFDFEDNRIKRLTNDKRDDYRPAVYGDKVVWCRSGPIEGCITVYDGRKSRIVKGAYGIFPRVSSEGVLYSDILKDRLYFYNWKDIIDLGDCDIEYTQAPHNQQINEGKITWRKKINDFHEVFIYDVASGVTSRITEGESAQSHQICPPAVCRGYAAWVNLKDGKKYLRLYDGKKTLTLASAIYIDEPYFGDGLLVWAMGNVNEHIEIFIYNLSSHRMTRVTKDRFPDRYPIASGKHIAWQKEHSDYYKMRKNKVSLPPDELEKGLEIYLAEIHLSP